MTNRIYLNGFGYYAPAEILTNSDLQKLVDTNEEWIVSRTGIVERHMAAPGETNSDMAVHAAYMALEAAGLEPSELTAILYATATPDSLVPSTAATVQMKLGIHRVMAMDINAACSGFIYGLQVAQGLLAADPGHNILLLATELLTGKVNWQDRATCVLFGDGSGAVVMSAEKRAPQQPALFSNDVLLEGVMSSADGTSGGEALRMTDGESNGRRYRVGDKIGDDYFIRMNGREIYKHAVRNMPEICNKLMDSLGYTIRDIDALIPHQANIRIVEAVGERLNMPPEKVFINIQKYGNTSCASIPMALCEALEQNFIRPGMRVLITAFGGGFTWGAAVLKF